MTPPRLAVVATHPTQHHAPLFRRLAARGAVLPRVFYGWEGASTDGGAYDPDFEREIAWDVPLRGGYASEVVENVAEDPGTHHFAGIDTPGLPGRVEAWEADAVLVVGWSWRGHLRALRHFHGRVPVLFHGDSTLLDERPGPRVLGRRLGLRWVYRHVDHALAAGVHSSAYFRAHGVSGDRLGWAPPAVEDARFADPGADREAALWRLELGVPEGAPTFVFAGKLTSKKAPDVLLEAFLAFAPPEAHLVLVGSGPLEAALRDAADPRVHVVGFQNQSRMPAAYRLGDALVLPSRGPGETWGLAVNEAFAAGRPAVVSDRVGCAPDLVREGRTGHVVPAGDVAALGAALARLAADPARTRAMGLEARRLVAGWSMDRQAEAVEEAVCAMVGVEARPFEAPLVAA